MSDSLAQKVAIIIPTINRSSFVIRQLEYYHQVNCPHTIYIGDSSNAEHSTNIQKAVNQLKSKLNVVYHHDPKLLERQFLHKFLSQAPEKYACFSGDDDWQIPNSLTKCAQFLEENPDYSSAHGYAVAIRIKNNDVYNDLLKIKDYPRPEIQADSASQRMTDFLKRYYVPLFSVHRTQQMRQYHEFINKASDKSFSSEILPCTLSLIDGKSKRLNCLSLVRQIHDRHYALPDTFDWIVSKQWNENYQTISQILTEKLIAKDNISAKQAEYAVKEGMWSFIQTQLIREYPEVFPHTIIKDKESLSQKIKAQLPGLKKIYRKIPGWYKKKFYLHAEVVNPQSHFYQDFQPVLESFTKESSL